MAEAPSSRVLLTLERVLFLLNHRRSSSLAPGLMPTAFHSPERLLRESGTTQRVWSLGNWELGREMEWGLLITPSLHLEPGNLAKDLVSPKLTLYSQAPVD